MFKKTIGVIVFLAALVIVPAAGAFGLHFNFSVEEIPMYIIGMDKDARPFGSFFNIANLGLGLNIDDNLGLKFRVKDTFFGLTNSAVTVSNQNNLYIDRLSVFFNSDIVNVLAGRDVYVENDGMLIGNLADGANLDFNLFGLKEKLYVYYSGLLPKDVNQFSADIYDYTNASGASRLNMALVLQKFGLLTKSVSLMGLYSMDMSTNKYFNPVYAALMSDGIVFIPQLTYNVTAALEFGSMTSNLNVFAWAGNLTLIYLLMDAPVKILITGQFAMASGNGTNSTNTYYGFDSFGKFNTGYVLNPNFSNLLFFRLGAASKMLDDHLDVKLNYYYLTRMSTNDTVNGYYNGTNAQVGHEFSLSANYEFDPNLSVFANAGVLTGNQSITNKTTAYKVNMGVAVRF